MKRILTFLYSSSLTFFLLLILGIALGVATFIEEKYDTATAQDLVYHARWFEIIFVLLVINLAGHIIRFKMFKRSKLPSLLFHVALVVIIIGAAVTRYIGFEGTMHIREGETCNFIYTSEPYLQVSEPTQGHGYVYDAPFILKSYGQNSFHHEYQPAQSGSVVIDYAGFIPNAVKKLKLNVPGGQTYLVLQTMAGGAQQNHYIVKGTSDSFGNLTVGYDSRDSAGTIRVVESEGKLLLTSPVALVMTDMATKSNDTLQPGVTVELKNNIVFSAGDVFFLYNGHYKDATTELVSGGQDESGADVLILNLTFGGKKHIANIYGGSQYYLQPQEFDFDGRKFLIGYGQKPIELPFSIKLRDFILDRYAGSMSPSSYASEVTLIDNRKNLSEDRRIFMNNVLDYDMYRFFQSSYDTDEKGTILSVNHDYFGTKITYFGYFLLSLGFILTLFNKNSRFRSLALKIKELNISRKSVAWLILGFLWIPALNFAQNGIPKPVPVEHADKFGKLLVQTVDGRFEPVNTMAFDILHKISRKDQLDIPGKGKMNAVQVVIDMMIMPEFWKEQKIIYIREKSVRDMLGINDSYASFLDFFDAEKHYKLQKYSEEAFRKKQSAQNSFDKEIIRVDERLNVFVMSLEGSMLKLFPEQGAANNKWISWNEKAAGTPLSGVITVMNQDLRLEPFNYTNIMGSYLSEVSKGVSTGDFSGADKIAGYISSIQRGSPGSNLLASDTKINLEILYNKLQIFIVLRNLYAVLSMVLLLFAFIDNLKREKSRLVTWVLNISTGILGIAFLYHTFGMALRWYLSGHAPWSNGYESLILIAWGGLLAGFSFARYSRITLAATTLLAFFVLMTASHSSYDPQLTNLQPVLKSYWLIIHVATLTISYGFLGLGFILGLINLIIGLFKNQKNRNRLDLVIAELTCINEMNLIVGIVMATIGTFLGGVWANESWGRYWGWDAKETWALVIVIAYTMVLHFRFIPKMRNNYVFNAASVIGFGSVIMTFVGVNYYLSKGMHSYGAGDTPVFPLWAWGIILSILSLIVVSGIYQRFIDRKTSSVQGRTGKGH